MSVDIKRAVGIAMDHIRSLMGNVHNLRLEEVEKTKSGPGWLVTISFLPGEETDSAIASLLASKREYKQIEINGMGQPIAMRIRRVG